MGEEQSNPSQMLLEGMNEGAMRILGKFLWIAFLFLASLAFIVAGLAVALVVGLVLLLLSRRVERSLTPAQTPDIRIYPNADGTLAPRPPEAANAR